MERSQRKLRPSLPRLKDCGAVPQAPKDPRQGRDASGRFAPGHRGARGQGWKRALAPLAGRHVKASELHVLAGDAGSLFRARLRELPHDGPTVSALVAEGSRSAVLSAHFAARALEVGLETAKGRALLELSMKLGARSERTSVTAFDMAQRLAEAEKKRNPPTFPWMQPDADDEEDDEPEPAAAADASAGVGTASASSENENAAAGRTAPAAHEGGADHE